MAITTKVADLVYEDVKRVYSGMAGKCCCGCSGTYRYTLRGAMAACVMADAPDPREVNDVQGRKVFKTVVADPDVEPGRLAPGGYVCRTVGKRFYVVYLNDKG